MSRDVLTCMFLPSIGSSLCLASLIYRFIPTLSGLGPRFKFSHLRASLLTVLCVVFAIVWVSSDRSIEQMFVGKEPVMSPKSV